MSDILFLTPNMSCKAFSEPTGTLILGTLLKKAGFSVSICPLGRFGKKNDPFEHFLQAAVNYILQSGAKIVSFYTRCDTYHLDIRIAQELKRRNPDLYIVFGGPQSDLCAIDTILKFPCIDFICRGEGEKTVVPFFSSLLQGAPDLSVPGLVCMRDGSVRENPRPEMLEDFSASEIDYQLLVDTGDSISGGFLLDVGRGCPFSCTFCSTKLFWKRHYRLKAPMEIVEEMRLLHDRFGVSEFGFEHDMFTMDRKKVIEICSEIKKLPFHAGWTCSARLDCVDEELIDVMADAGLRAIYFGIETGSPRMQKLINKNLKLSKAEQIVTHMEQKGLSATLSFIYGFPEETPEDLSMTLDLWLAMKAHKNVSCQTHLLAFFPGTELELKYRDQLTLSSLFSNQTGNLWVNDCMDLIADNPSIFSQYRSLCTPLRESTDRLPVFLNTFSKLSAVFSYLAQTHFNSIYEMYLDWRTYAEATTLQGKSRRIYAAADAFIQQFADDPLFPQMQGICRYLLDKAVFSEASNEVVNVNSYAFRISDLSEAKSLASFSAGSTVVSFSRTPDGKVIESIVATE